MKKYYLIYQITNKINGFIYIGCHTTINPKDNYMGSGTLIIKAIKEYGIENFEKIILFKFNNKKDMLNKEREIVDKNFIARQDTYNVIIGGQQFLTLDTVSVKDKDGNFFRVHKKDSRYLSGELLNNMVNTTYVKNNIGEVFQVDINDPRIISEEFISIFKDRVLVKDKNNNYFNILKTDQRYLSGELVPYSKNMILVKDKFNNVSVISKNDFRYLSKELVGFWTDRKHTEETKEKMKKSQKGKHIGIKNSQYDTCWIHNNKENKKIKKEDLQKYLNMGWIKGRKMKFNL